MAAYYNEHDKFAAAWLRELIKTGLIADGEVDERNIEDVVPSELTGFTQCHFFAGIGVWSYALRKAGWSDDRPVWTGSCPCQPFSSAGKGVGFADERHLWPAFCHLISQCRPSVVFGEQVASKDGLAWLDLIQADLEGAGYAVGAVDTCAAGVGAPHIRQRLYWVADANLSQLERARVSSRMDSTITRVGDGRLVGGYWKNADWLQCQDNKWRAIESGIKPLVNRPAARVGRLRGYGNAIVAPQAQAFINAYMEVTCANSFTQ